MRIFSGAHSTKQMITATEIDADIPTAHMTKVADNENLHPNKIPLIHHLPWLRFFSCIDGNGIFNGTDEQAAATNVASRDTQSFNANPALYCQ